MCYIVQLFASLKEHAHRKYICQRLTSKKNVFSFSPLTTLNKKIIIFSLLYNNLTAPDYYHVLRIYSYNQIKFNWFNLAHQTPYNINKAMFSPLKNLVMFSEKQKKVYLLLHKITLQP